MRKDFYVYIFIPTHNSVDLLDVTVSSLNKQTFDRNRMRIVFIDNASTDGTYEKELSYIMDNPILYSVIRENIATTEGRLLKKAINALCYASIDFSLLLAPGDVLYPDSIRQNILLLTFNTTAMVLVAETDLIYNGENAIKQIPIFEDNCILRGGFDNIQYYAAGRGHKVQVIFRGHFLETTTKLPYFAQLNEFNEWFTMVYYATCKCIYTKEISGCIRVSIEEDPINRLMKRAFFIKRNFYAAETKVSSTIKADSIELLEISAGYRALAIMALQFALEQIKYGTEELALDCLTFAEMIDLSIVDHQVYHSAVMAIQDKTKVNSLEVALKQRSVVPPKECGLF